LAVPDGGVGVGDAESEVVGCGWALGVAELLGLPAAAAVGVAELLGLPAAFAVGAAALVEPAAGPADTGEANELDRSAGTPAAGSVVGAGAGTVPG
jgi:hypothetical protein